jgi:lipopolysaccharide export system permease protein
MTMDKKHLYLHLYKGEMFENLKAQTTQLRSVSYRREIFSEKHLIIQFDSEFNMIDGNFMSNQSSSKNMNMLQASIDSMSTYGDSLGKKYYIDAKITAYQKVPKLSKADTFKLTESRINDYNVDSLYNTLTLSQKQHVLSLAITHVNNLESDWNFKSYTIANNDRSIRRHATEWHKKITISFSCIIFFFIGAPLGAIIRKGGLGMPVIVSICIFIFYYLIDNTGYKMARDGNWIVWIGMWTSTVVLAPVGAFFTYKSNKDSVVLNADSYLQWVKQIINIRTVRNLVKKEVIITDPDYQRITTDLKELSTDCKKYLQDRQYSKTVPNYIKLWIIRNETNEKILFIINRLETLVEEMSNTTSPILLNAINKYPIIPVNAHMRPFRNHWLNIAAGLILPIGLFVYYRIWLFGFRLHKDLEQVIKISEDVHAIIIKQSNNINEYERRNKTEYNR